MDRQEQSHWRMNNESLDMSLAINSFQIKMLAKGLNLIMDQSKITAMGRP